MKEYEIIAVYDNLTESFLQPTFTGSIPEGQRLFEYQINSIDLWKANSQDYDLFSLGKYDAETGIIKSQVHKIVNGKSVLRKEVKE